jgi:hypothetical protein
MPPGYPQIRASHLAGGRVKASQTAGRQLFHLSLFPAAGAGLDPGGGGVPASQWDRAGQDVFAYFNNDGDANAVRNARALRALLGRDG